MNCSDNYVTPEWIAENHRKAQLVIEEMKRRNPEGKLSKLGEWLNSKSGPLLMFDEKSIKR